MVAFVSANGSELPDVRDPDAVRRFLEEHLHSINGSGDPLDNTSKDGIRLSHLVQRRERALKDLASLGNKTSRLLDQFADGSEVCPERIDPAIHLVEPNSSDGDLFRLATLLWSVPVSRGYGRRMRYLVRDRSNAKLIGIFALGDPVFNLRPRDEWIGWNVEQRRERLAHVMDAYIVGAVPPYNQLLGGKLVASLMGSDEVRTDFETKYRGRMGLISGKVKPPDLALITVTSALGRSSIYNRLRLDGMPSLEPIGYTTGWGHFQVNDEMFRVIRDHLAHVGHKYANGHQFGEGPNWKLRTIRQGLDALGLDSGVLRHGIQRQIFAMMLCCDTHPYLRGEAPFEPATRSLSDVAEAALARWVIPRSQRIDDYRKWQKSALSEQFYSSVSQMTIDLKS